MRSEVWNIDCMEGMKRFKDKEIDLAIVDPPYFSGPEKREFYGKKYSSKGVKRVSYKKSDEWEVPGSEYFEELERVSKNYVVWGCNYFNHPFHSGRIVWDKVNDSSDYSDCEIAATDLFDHVRILRYMWNGMMQGSRANGAIMEGNKKKNEKRIHPTQKPIQLYRMIFTRFVQPGAILMILDTHLGSGSHRIAAHEFGHDFIAFEKDKMHFDNQEARYREHTAQMSLSIR